MSSLEKLVLAAAAEEISSERRGRRDVVTTYAQAIAENEELRRHVAALLRILDALEFDGADIRAARRAVADHFPDAGNMVAAQPAQPVAVPDGWALVPVEPTKEMVAAWPNNRHGSGHEAAIYRAMLAAAPAAPKREPLTREEREVVYALAEQQVRADHNLAWRDAIVIETERAHGITKEPQ